MRPRALRVLVVPILAMVTAPVQASLMFLADTAELLVATSLIESPDRVVDFKTPVFFRFTANDAGLAHVRVSNELDYGFGGYDGPTVDVAPDAYESEVGSYTEFVSPTNVEVFYAIEGWNVRGGSANGLACFRTTSAFSSIEECRDVADSFRVTEPGTLALLGLGLLGAGLVRQRARAK